MKHGSALEDWRAHEWERWTEAQAYREPYESPLFNSMIGGREGWAELHLIEAHPMEAVPVWAWHAVRSFFRTRSTGHLPYDGGHLDQPARLMAAFGVLSSALAEIEESQRMIDDFHKDGKG